LKKYLVSLAFVTAGSLLLSGCAGLGADSSEPAPITPITSGAPAGFEKYYEQVVEFAECGDGLFCAEVEVPMNWDDPQSESITIATAYRKADKKDPVGFVLFNPGGPGASGYDWVIESSDFLGTKVLRENFNIMGFDPRGVGRSSAVSCLSDEEYDEFLYGVTGFELGSDEDLAAGRAAVKEFGQKCLENTGDLLGHVDTISAAKDMDLLRAILGQEKLHYLGYSYGSLLGTVYANLFPDRVGQFVLDGAIDPTVPDEQQTLFQIQAFEKALRAFLESCEEYRDCPFTGFVEGDLKTIKEFFLELETNSLPTDSGRELTIWAAVTGLIMPLYSETYWPYLSTAFDMALNDGQGDLFLMLADQYNDRGEDGTYATNLIAANYAISCLDSRASTNIFSMRRQNQALIDAAPTLGKYWQYGALRCETWPFDTKPALPSFSAEGAPTILVVGTTGDPATPYSQAQSLAGSILNDGFLLTYNGEGHTVYGQQIRCVDNVVDTFFLTAELPDSDPNCQAP
jgi:pimeloyl-ACP methyl ester carboxylesterase